MNIATLPADSNPKLEDFLPLAEHEAQTPSTFFGGKPVLHYHVEDAELLLNEALYAHESVGQFIANVSTSIPANHTGTAESDDPPSMKTIHPATIFVSSQTLLILHSNGEDPQTARTLSIPYPAISLHATQTLPSTPAAPSAPARQAIYLQLDPAYSAPDAANPAHDDDDALPPLLELCIVPPAAPSSPSPSPVQAMYEALTRCAELHPSPVAPGDGELEGEGPGLAGGGLLGGGWITSENAHLFANQFADPEDGEGEGEGEGNGEMEGDDAEAQALGPGAGTRRGREEVNGHVADDGDADADEAADEDETKWRRTE